MTYRIRVVCTDKGTHPLRLLATVELDDEGRFLHLPPGHRDSDLVHATMVTWVRRTRLDLWRNCPSWTVQDDPQPEQAPDLVIRRED